MGDSQGNRDGVSTSPYGLDRRLYPLAVLLALALAGDIWTRFRGESTLVNQTPVEAPGEDVAVSNRSASLNEMLKIAEYLDAIAEPAGDMLTEEIANPQSEAQARLDAESYRLEQEAIEDALFGESGILLLAIFVEEAPSAVLNVLDRETRERRLLELGVGESVNGYTIDVLSRLNLEAMNSQGKRIKLKLFEREPDKLK